MRQLEEYESKLGYGSVAESMAHPEAASEIAPSPKAKRPCLSLPLNTLLNQAVTPTSFTKDSVSFVFEASSGPSGSKSARSSPLSGGSPSSTLPGCHSPLVSQVCHSPLLSPSWITTSWKCHGINLLLLVVDTLVDICVQQSLGFTGTVGGEKLNRYIEVKGILINCSQKL